MLVRLQNNYEKKSKDEKFLYKTNNGATIVFEGAKILPYKPGCNIHLELHQGNGSQSRMLAETDVSIPNLPNNHSIGRRTGSHIMVDCYLPIQVTPSFVPRGRADVISCEARKKNRIAELFHYFQASHHPTSCCPNHR